MVILILPSFKESETKQRNKSKTFVKDELLFILALEHQPSLDSGLIAKH